MSDLEGWPADPVSEAVDLIAAGQAREAATRLAALIGAGRGGLLARMTWVRALLACGDARQALAEAREVSQLAPSLAEAAVVFGKALEANNALPAAIAEYQRALRLDPECGAAELALAFSWAEAGEAEKAEGHLQAAENLGQRSDDLRARIAALKQAQRSDAGYVRHLFDQFSSDYDARMRGALAYRAPEILAELALLVSGGKLKKAQTLDLGCGTGLAAPVFRPFATKLSGLDLSPQMIGQAEKTGLYDTLIVGDAEPYLTQTPARFGRVIAADVFVYIGDLNPVFEGVRRVLKPGGLFLFTVERSEGDAPFMLQETRRWAHTRAYIEQLAVAFGFDVRGLIDCTPRVNKGVPIPGLAAALAV